MITNPILVVDDDPEDLELIREAFQELQPANDILYFATGEELMNYLQKSSKSPFLILCDVNLPRLNGFDIRSRIAENKETHYKSVPFVFWSTSASEQQIRRAYDLPAQGFFVKPHSYQGLLETLRTILEYWRLSQHPKPL